AVEDVALAQPTRGGQDVSNAVAIDIAGGNVGSKAAAAAPCSGIGDDKAVTAVEIGDGDGGWKSAGLAEQDVHILVLVDAADDEVLVAVAVDVGHRVAPPREIAFVNRAVEEEAVRVAGGGACRRADAAAVLEAGYVDQVVEA